MASSWISTSRRMCGVKILSCTRKRSLTLQQVDLLLVGVGKVIFMLLRLPTQVCLKRTFRRCGPPSLLNLAQSPLFILRFLQSGLDQHLALSIIKMQILASVYLYIPLRLGENSTCVFLGFFCLFFNLYDLTLNLLVIFPYLTSVSCCLLTLHGESLS